MLALPIMIIARFNKSHGKSSRFFFQIRQNERISQKTHTVPVPFLFLGKPATLSTSHSMYPAVYATDGDVNTFFHTNGPEIGGWLRVDLQTTHCIQGVNLINRNLQQGTFKFSLSYSGGWGRGSYMTHRGGHSFGARFFINCLSLSPHWHDRIWWRLHTRASEPLRFRLWCHNRYLRPQTQKNPRMIEHGWLQIS